MLYLKSLLNIVHSSLDIPFDLSFLQDELFPYASQQFLALRFRHLKSNTIDLISSLISLTFVGMLLLLHFIGYSLIVLIIILRIIVRLSFVFVYFEFILQLRYRVCILFFSLVHIHIKMMG